MASKGHSAEELAGWLYDSLHDKLLDLPDETLVYPAHGAGSLCGRNMSTDTFSTFGVQRAYNYALQPMTREEFIEIAVADLLPSPAYFGLDAELNRKEHPFSARDLELRPLSLAEVLTMTADGAQVLDARDATDFAATHMRGSTNIALDGSFAQWAGSVLDFERPIVLIVSPGGEAEVVVRLARVGLENVAGFLDGGM
jgi:rhodanese-related sulfurtransferase